MPLLGASLGGSQDEPPRHWWPHWRRPRCGRGAAPGYTCRMDKEGETTGQSGAGMRRFRRPLLLLAALVLAGAAPVMYVWRMAPMPAKENPTRPGPAFWAELERQEREARLNDFEWQGTAPRVTARRSAPGNPLSTHPWHCEPAPNLHLDDVARPASTEHWRAQHISAERDFDRRRS